MAINAPIIRPDPVSNLLESFKVADTSVRDYARIHLEQQAQNELAVQRARENKARDFKLMLDAVGRQDDLKQHAIDNEFKRDQLGIQMFTARTGRLNAEAMGDYRQEQLGLAQTRADTSRMNAEQLADYRREQIGISRMNAEGLNAYRQRRIGAGGTNGDPLGYARKAASAPTGDFAPSSLPLPEGPSDPGVPPSTLTDQDLQGFRRDWTPSALPEPTGLPDIPAGVSDPVVSEAPPDLSLQPPSPGTYAGEGEEGSLFPPEAMPADGAEGVEGAAGPPAPPPTLSPPAAASAAEGDLLPPPRLQTPSFAGVDLTRETHNTFFNLYKANAVLTIRSKQSAQRAARIAAVMPKVSEENVPIYQERYNREVQAAQADAIGASEAAVKAERLKAQAKVVEARQAEIAALSHLDGVLPEADRAELVADASSPEAGGRADYKIKVLKGYDQVRQAQMLDHPSNGIKTAEMVARRGLALETTGALKAKEDAALAKNYRNRLANLGPVPEDEQEKKTFNTNKTKLETKLMELEVGEEQWKELQDNFKAAVKADTWHPPTDETDHELEILKRHRANAQSPSSAPTPAAAPATGQGFLQQAPPPPPVKGDGGKYWSEGKDQAAALAHMDGGKDAQGNVIPAMNEAELQAIVDGRAPVLGGQTSVRIGGGMGAGVGNPSGVQYGPKYSEQIAERIAPAFKAPAGDKDARGRSGEVTVEEFLREAAKDRLARLKSSAVSKLAPEMKSKRDAILEKYKLPK